MAFGSKDKLTGIWQTYCNLNKPRSIHQGFFNIKMNTDWDDFANLQYQKWKNGQWIKIAWAWYLCLSLTYNMYTVQLVETFLIQWNRSSQTDTLVSGQFYFNMAIFTKPVYPHSHTNSAFLHSHKRPAPVLDVFFMPRGCLLARASTVIQTKSNFPSKVKHSCIILPSVLQTSQ